MIHNNHVVNIWPWDLWQSYFPTIESIVNCSRHRWQNESEQQQHAPSGRSTTPRLRCHDIQVPWAFEHRKLPFVSLSAIPFLTTDRTVPARQSFLENVVVVPRCTITSLCLHLDVRLRVHETAETTDIFARKRVSLLCQAISMMVNPSEVYVFQRTGKQMSGLTCVSFVLIQLQYASVASHFSRRDFKLYRCATCITWWVSFAVGLNLTILNLGLWIILNCFPVDQVWGIEEGM